MASWAAGGVLRCAEGRAADGRAREDGGRLEEDDGRTTLGGTPPPGGGWAAWEDTDRLRGAAAAEELVMTGRGTAAETRWAELTAMECNHEGRFTLRKAEPGRSRVNLSEEVDGPAPPWSLKPAGEMVMELFKIIMISPIPAPPMPPHSREADGRRC